jgi:hypothetical protein
MIAARRLAYSVLLALVLTRVAAAHPIVIHTGSVEWVDQRLRLTLSLDQHSLDHEIAALGHFVTPQRVVRTLAHSIHVISHESERMLPSQVEVAEDGARVTCEYAIQESVNALALVHRPLNGLAPFARQIQLTCLSGPASDAHTIRLTSGGNHAVIRRRLLMESEASGDACFSEPVLVVSAESGTRVVNIRIDYPCPLLATWPDLITVSNGAITGAAFRGSRSTISDCARACLVVQDLCGGVRGRIVEKVDLIGPSGEILSGSADESFSIYTTRVRIQIAYEHAESAASTAITWRGFHAGLLGMAAQSEMNGITRSLGNLTSLQATVRVAHTEPPRATVVR